MDKSMHYKKSDTESRRLATTDYAIASEGNVRQKHFGESREFEETTWAEEAACAGHPTEVFFVDVGQSSNIPIAKAI